MGEPCAGIFHPTLSNQASRPPRQRGQSLMHLCPPFTSGNVRARCTSYVEACRTGSPASVASMWRTASVASTCGTPRRDANRDAMVDLPVPFVPQITTATGPGTAHTPAA